MVDCAKQGRSENQEVDLKLQDTNKMLEAIGVTEEEQRRLEFLQALAEQITEVTNTSQEEERRWILKGGTALIFALGLERPSMDLDYEGEKGQVRGQIKRAAKKVEKTTDWKKMKVGVDWRFRGTMGIEAESGEGTRIRTWIDHRAPGFRNIPIQLPYESTVVHNGVLMYEPETLAQRKLQTIIGKDARWKPRDVYDAAWLTVNRPELLSRGTVREIEETARRERRRKLLGVRNKWLRDHVMGRVDPDQAITILLEAVEVHRRGIAAREKAEGKAELE